MCTPIHAYQGPTTAPDHQPHASPDSLDQPLPAWQRPNDLLQAPTATPPTGTSPYWKYKSLMTAGDTVGGTQAVIMMNNLGKHRAGALPSPPAQAAPQRQSHTTVQKANNNKSVLLTGLASTTSALHDARARGTPSAAARPWIGRQCPAKPQVLPHLPISIPQNGEKPYHQGESPGMTGYSNARARHSHRKPPEARPGDNISPNLGLMTACTLAEAPTRHGMACPATSLVTDQKRHNISPNHAQRYKSRKPRQHTAPSNTPVHMP